jgi:hypothetical protein
VTVARLDTIYRHLVSEVQESRPFLKLDTQGWYATVVAGATDVLSEMAGLQTELSVQSIYEGAAYYLDVLPVLQRRGFDVAGLYPVTLEVATYAVIEFDCLLVRSRPDDRRVPNSALRATGLPA